MLFLCRRRPTMDVRAPQRRNLFPRFLPLLFCFVCFPVSARADSLSSDQQIRSSYARLDAAYSKRDVPAIMAFLSPRFMRHEWKATLTPAQFEAELNAESDGTTSVAAASHIQFLDVVGDRAEAVVARRLDFTLPKPLPLVLPPYFQVTVTQEEWHKRQGQWRMTEMADVPLVRELSALDERDQGIRRQYIADPNNPAIAVQMRQIDATDRVRLKQIIQQHGWPGFDLAGTTGEGIAFEIVQHSDDDIAFQKRCLPLIQAAVKRGQAMPSDDAYLTDRILWGEHKPQIYGTQRNTPIEDAAHVDQRRARVGLGSLAVYEQQLKHFYAPSPKP